MTLKIGVCVCLVLILKNDDVWDFFIWIFGNRRVFLIVKTDEWVFCVSTDCIMGKQAMEEQSFHLWKYTWKISNFTNLTQKKYSSEVFTLSDNAW